MDLANAGSVILSFLFFTRLGLTILMFAFNAPGFMFVLLALSHGFDFLLIKLCRIGRELEAKSFHLRLLDFDRVLRP